jgi:hypothetical protein
MARENNFLLGNGERLTRPEEKYSHGGSKHSPYTFGEAQNRLSAKLQQTVAENAKLTPEVCPNGETVAIVTMHPRYISKTDFPAALLGEVGLRPIGNRMRDISPEKWGTKKPPSTPMLGEDIFVAGQRDAFAQWSLDIEHWSPGGVHNYIVGIEEIGPFSANSKIRALPDLPGKEVLLEAVLHNANSREILENFYAYATNIGAKPLSEFSRKVKGLTFIPVRCAFESVTELAAFSFLRVVRGMPSLRSMTPSFLRSMSTRVTLPKTQPPPTAPNVAVFDGGIPETMRDSLSPWVNYVEGHNIGPRSPELETHGLGVTSALLFGPLSDGSPPAAPHCRATHVRVVDADDDGSDLMYVKVLRRITRYMTENRDKDV